MFSLVSHSLPSSFLLFDGVSASPRSCQPCLPFSPHMGACVVCPRSRGLASFCLPLSPHMCACVGWRICLPEGRTMKPAGKQESKPARKAGTHPKQASKPASQPASKQASKPSKQKPNKINVYNGNVFPGTYCKHFHHPCRCYFMCLSLFPKSLLESTHCLGPTVV